nr:hypothetical protein [Tanacetum cinerariifolium]
LAVLRLYKLDKRASQIYKTATPGISTRMMIDHILMKLKIKLVEQRRNSRSKENTKCVSAAGKELTVAKHKLILLELKLFRDADAAAHMK